MGRRAPLNHLFRALDVYRIALQFIVQDRLMNYLSHHIVSFRRWNCELKKSSGHDGNARHICPGKSRYFIEQSIVAAEFEKSASAAYDMTKSDTG